MLFESVLFGLAAGLLLGGSLRSLTKASFRCLPLIFVAAVIDFAMSTRLGTSVAAIGGWAVIAATVLQTILLIVFVLGNMEKPPLWLIGLGGLMNSAAILANSGMMPISPQILVLAPDSPYTLTLLAGRVANYTLANPATKLLFLSDIIPFRGFTFYMISAGDMVTSAGLIILIISLMQAYSPRYTFFPSKAFDTLDDPPSSD
ncbi:MAG: hypothetical protein BWY00_00988 [Firmicutes bacterium ADurb.Bin153]|nr:MAG: hypothetical protein BWY00_00988 [Firmicutes bacterium ADurb.Bin153]HPU96139.1 DUF5317 family protein [Bacillota bacterium]